MTEGALVWIERMTSVGADSTVDMDLCDVGIVVLNNEGRVTSANARARALLRAESPSTLNDRLSALQRELAEAGGVDGFMDETSVEVPGIGLLGVRSSAIEGTDTNARVLLLRDMRSVSSTAGLLEQASRHRALSFLSRDWAHDLKGMLHVIRINSALLGRLLQRDSITTDGPIGKCLEAIPREVERLDRSIEQMFSAKSTEQRTIFDVGAMCDRVKNLIAGRAIRQRVEVVFEQKVGLKEIVGFEDQVQGAILNVIINALEAMPDQGRLVITAEGNAQHVTIRVCDSGAGMQPQPDSAHWRPHFVNDRRQTGIGLHVTRVIVESHDGRIECASNVPHGTCIEITFPPAASTGLEHGSRTYR